MLRKVNIKLDINSIADKIPIPLTICLAVNLQSSARSLQFFTAGNLLPFRISASIQPATACTFFVWMHIIQNNENASGSVILVICNI